MLRTRTRGLVAAAVIVLLLAPATSAAVSASASGDHPSIAARSLIEWAGGWLGRLGNALRPVSAASSTDGVPGDETGSPADPDQSTNPQPTAPEDGSDVGPVIDPNG